MVGMQTNYKYYNWVLCFDLLVKKSAMERTYWNYNQLKKKLFRIEKLAIIRYTNVAFCPEVTTSVPECHVKWDQMGLRWYGR
jgi:hypothetical protein